MAVSYQIVPVNFSGGLDQKTAEQLVIPGKFLVLENCVRRKLGKIQKRYGFTELSKNIVGSSTIASGALLTKLNSDVVQVSGDKIYSYIPSSDRWVNRGTISSLTTSSQPIIRNSDTQTMPDIVSYNGLVASVWEDSRSNKAVQVSVFDKETGASILTDTTVSATGVRPKVIGIASKIFITYIEGTVLKAKTIDVGNPTSLSSEIIVDGAVVDAAYDLTTWSTNYGIMAYRSDTNEITVCYITAEGVRGGPTVALPSPVTLSYNAGTSLTIERAPDVDLIYVTASRASAANTDFWVFGPSLLASDTISIIGLQAANATIGARAGGFVDVYTEFAGAGTRYRLVYKTVLSISGVTITEVSTAAEFKRSVGLASKAFVSGNYSYVVTTHQSPLQSTYFTIRSDGFIASRNFAGLGGGLTAKSGLSRVTDSFITALVVKNSFAADNDQFVLSSNSGITRLDIGVDNSSYNNAQLGQNLHMAGGLLLNYDGDSVTEHGFNLYPEDISIALDNSGNINPHGLYYYRVTYEWIDAKGQRHQSAPSIQLEADVQGTSTDRVALTIPCLQLTSKTAPRSEVRIVVWRGTTGSDQVFYRLMDTPNIIGTNTVVLYDTGSVSNETLATREVLYTTGGVVENIAPSSCTSVVLHKNRLWLGGLDENGYIAYSKEFVNGEGVAFSDFFTIPVDPASGNVTALASMDDKLIIFKRDAVYTLVGDGPLDTGNQNDFTLPQFITGDLGCINPKSIASIPDGIMFKSDKGIYLLTRTLQFIYVGQGVEDFNNLTITSAVVLEDVNEVRFTTSDGAALVFNYEFTQWSTFSNYEAVSAINGLGSYLHLKSDGTVRKESTSYLDAGSRIKMTIETSWLAFAGLQGYQRIRSWMLLGDFLSDHYTKVSCFYDYESFASETVYFNVDNGLDLSYYGDDLTYGDSQIYGGSGSSVFQFTSQPRVQKCQSMKLRIEDIDTKTSLGGGSFNLVGLTCEVGSKTTLTKQLRGNKSVGS